MSRGLFVVLEGIDGAGTTTQTDRLARSLRRMGQRVHATREPSTGPIGALLRQILSGRLLAGSRRRPGVLGAPEWETMALLFAADRLDHVATEIEPVVAAGGIVLSDRYDASSLAYQSVTSNGDDDALDWIRTLNRRALRPDLVVVLDVPVEIAEARRASRGDADELYDARATQVALAEFYRALAVHAPRDRIVVISGEGSADDVEARVLAAVMQACSPTLDVSQESS